MADSTALQFPLSIDVAKLVASLADAQAKMTAGMKGMSQAVAKEIDQINQSLANIKGLDTMAARGAEAGQALARLKTEAERLGNAWRQSKLDLDRMPAAVDAVKQSISALNAVPKKSLTEEQKKELVGLKDRLKDLSSQQEALRVQTGTLANDYQRAGNAVQRTAKAVTENASSVDSLRGRLRLAGIDTGNLAAEQTKLQSALASVTAKAKEQGKLQSAKDVLGLSPQPNTEREIDRVRAAYERLRASGTLSSAELAKAHVAMTEKIIAAGKDTDTLASKFALVRGQLAKLAVAGVGIVAATKEAMQFESVNKSLLAGVEELSRRTPVTIENLVKIAKAGSQMGIPAKDIKEFTELTSKMSVAFKVDASEAGTSIGQMMRVFGLTIPQTRLLGDAILYLGKNTKATGKDILTVMTHVGGMAKVFGLTTTEAAALASTFLSLGRPPEIAATSINALLLTLQSAGSRDESFKQSLQGIGLSAEQLAVDIARNPQAALVCFLETLKNLDKQTQVETLTKLFRREQADDIAVLLTGLDRYKEALGLVAKESNYADTIEKKFSERLKTTESQLQLAKNAINEAGISIGMVFLPAVNAAAQAVAFLAQGIAKLVNEFPNLSATALTAVGTFTGFGALRMAWSVLRSGIVGLIAPLLSLGTAARTAVGAFTWFGALRMAWAVLRSGILGLIAPILSLGTAARALMFTPLGAVLTAAGVAAYAFSKATESSIPPLLENASALAKSREETVGKIKSLETLKKTLESTAPGTKEHTDAEEKLAAILPGANLSIDAQGRVLAKVGSATRDNTKAMNSYLAELKQSDSNTFAMQLETQARALTAAKNETAEYADGLKRWYGIGTDEAQTATQRFWLWMGKLTRSYDSNIAKGAELRRQLGDTEDGLKSLVTEAQKSGMSVESLSKAMDKIRADPAVKDQVVALYRSMAQEADKTASKTASVAEQLKQFSIALKGPAAAAKAQIIDAIKVTEEQTSKYNELLTKQREALKQAVNDQQKSWKAMGDAATAWSKAEIDSISEVYAARQNKLADKSASGSIFEKELLAETTSLAVAESTAKIAETRRYQAEALKLINDEYRVRIANAERMKEDSTRIDEERLQAQKAILEKTEAAYKASIDKLIAEERRHLESARQLAQERANFNLSVQDKLANLAEKGMSPETAYNDKQRRIAEEQKQAKAALDKGDYDSAKSHAERMIALAEQTSDAVVDGDRTIVTAQDAVAKSSAQIKAAAEIVNNAMKAQEEVHKKAAEELHKQSASMMEDLDNVRNRMERLDAAIAADHKLIISTDTKKIDEAAAKVDDLIAKIKTLDTLKAGLQGDAKTVEKIPDNVAQGNIDQVQAQLKPLADSFAKFKEEFKNFDPEIAKNLKVELATAAIDGLATKFQEFQTQMDAAPPSEIKISANTSQADSAMAKVVAEANALDGRVVTYYVNQVTQESHAVGGTVGLARGGALPGWGGGDRIHALLEAGEFVVRKEAVGRYGQGLFESLNHMRLPEIPRFAFGGLVRNIIIPSVQRVPAFATGGSVQPVEEGVVRLELFAGGRPVASIPGPRQQIRQFVDALKELQRGVA